MTEHGHPPPSGRGFAERVIGALKLDASVYDEVEHDEDATLQAGLVVVIAAVAAGVGGAGASGVVGSLLGWVVSAAFVWFVGVRWMEHSSDFPELLRTTGFATAPQLLMVLGVVPALGPLLILAAALWSLAAYVIAVREALDVETGRAVFICLLAFALRILTTVLLIALGGLLSAAF